MATNLDNMPKQTGRQKVCFLVNIVILLYLCTQTELFKLEVRHATVIRVQPFLTNLPVVSRTSNQGETCTCPCKVLSYNTHLS